MATVDAQILSAAGTISQNITTLVDDRGLLSQNILGQLRNLVEGVAVRLHLNDGTTEFDYVAVGPAMGFVKAKGQLSFVSRFHKLLQKSVSHYSLDGDPSERLMLKYYEYLIRLRDLTRATFGIEILANLEDFPIDLDPSLQEYHEKIAARVDAHRATLGGDESGTRYYIHKIRPFFVRGRIYYEVTFYRAINRVNKFDRIIGFTDIEMTDQYSASLKLATDSIDVLGQTMPITIIRGWEISIRPCELDNFARVFGITTSARSTSEYRFVMQSLTNGMGSLLDLLDMPDAAYGQAKAAGIAKVSKPQIFPVIDAARDIVRRGADGHNLIRYLMLHLRNEVVKAQFSRDACTVLSNLNLKYGCKPFDTMPFCTSPVGHNPRIADLLESLDVTDRVHELLARRVKTNVERHGILYTPLEEVEALGSVDDLIATYNQRLYYKHRPRRSIEKDNGHLVIRGYEDDTVAIIEQLQQLASSGVSGYQAAVERWLDERPDEVDDDLKKDALKGLFSESRVALIYGAAGTGKSTTVNHIAHYFNDKRKLFLAQTNPAVENLRRRVTAQNVDFRTISGHLRRTSAEPAYDVLVIDECSTVSNSDLLQVLQATTFELLVLVGDVYQIESIEFGNWFAAIPSFIPKTSVFELTTPYRTSSQELLDFWGSVRNIKDDIAESISRNGYASVLGPTLFEAQTDDEIILCLNYDGLYGINNVNRFLQASNTGAGATFRASTYKVGDPVLFSESERFRPLIYNNLKGEIVRISSYPDMIEFDVTLDRPFTELDTRYLDLEWAGDCTVRIQVYGVDNSDEDDDSLNTAVPFQVAYAVSIHKAQGLEYKSVKVVITDANEDDISHNVLYTAVTRAREKLRIFWTPETQQKILESLSRRNNTKDVALLVSRRGLARAS